MTEYTQQRPGVIKEWTERTTQCPKTRRSKSRSRPVPTTRSGSSTRYARLTESRKRLVTCQLTDDFEQVFERVESFRAKRQAAIETILFKDAGLKTRRRQKEPVDDKEARMLKQEKHSYIGYLSKSLHDFLPSEITSQETFLRKVHEKVRRMARRKKREDGQEGSSKGEDDEDEDIFFSDEEEDDDYNMNDYEGEDDEGGEDGGGED